MIFRNNREQDLWERVYLSAFNTSHMIGSDYARLHADAAVAALHERPLEPKVDTTEIESIPLTVHVEKNEEGVFIGTINELVEGAVISSGKTEAEAKQNTMRLFAELTARSIEMDGTFPLVLRQSSTPAAKPDNWEALKRIKRKVERVASRNIEGALVVPLWQIQGIVEAEKSLEPSSDRSQVEWLIQVARKLVRNQSATSTHHAELAAAVAAVDHVRAARDHAKV